MNAKMIEVSICPLQQTLLCSDVSSWGSVVTKTVQSSAVIGFPYLLSFVTIFQ